MACNFSRIDAKITRNVRVYLAICLLIVLLLSYAQATPDFIQIANERANLVLLSTFTGTPHEDGKACSNFVNGVPAMLNSPGRIDAARRYLATLPSLSSKTIS